tara:strand:+ start:2019 stop:2153 length:135 start_codon:yes stop_codon:yes gene_type:complete
MVMLEGFLKINKLHFSASNPESIKIDVGQLKNFVIFSLIHKLSI